METGLTIILAEMGILFPLVRVKLLILPTPLGAKPMEVLVFDHWYRVPETDDPVN